MLSIKNITKIYTSKKGASVEALNNVSADFGDSGLIFLLGKSGSGKSTMLNIIGGLDAPTSGEIIVKNRSSMTFKESDFDSYRNTCVGFVFQEYNLIDNYTVGENIGLALELQGKKAGRIEIDKTLHKVDLVDKKGETLYNRQVNELSGGQKQRVAIARALIKNPEIILADEPTGSLDGKTGRQFYELLKELSKEKLIIVVSHDRENAEKYGDRIIELSDGEIISDISPLPAASAKKTDTENREFIKSKLPFKCSFVMGASALKTKPFRLILSILLSVITFVAFGFSLTASMANEYTAELKLLYDNNQRMVTISGCARDSSGKVASGRKILSSMQLKELKKYNNNVDPMVIFYSGYDRLLADHLGDQTNFSCWSGYRDASMYSLQDFVELDPETGETDADLKPDPRFNDKSLCRLPQTYGEIAITDFSADMLMLCGYKDEAGTVAKINAPDELIGKRLGEFTITGVYATEQSIEDYKALINHPNNDYANRLMRGVGSSIVGYGFVCKGYKADRSLNLRSVFIKLSGDFGKDSKLIDKLTYRIGRNTYTSIEVSSAYSDLLYYASFFYSDYFLTFVIIAAAVFLVFAIILTINFLTVSLDFRKRELGILRALGARKRDMLMVCLAESLLIACIEFIISLVVLLIACLSFNKLYYISILNVGVMQIVLFALFIFGITALATILPIIRLARKKPIDIINSSQ